MDKHFEYDNVNLISIISKYRASVMGFAALWIYYFHIGKTDMLPGVLSEFEWFIHRISFCGVDIFIFLSAFGLSFSFRKRPIESASDYLNFIIRRLKRIYLVLIPATALMMVADGKTFYWLLLRLSFIENYTSNLYVFLWFVPCILVLYVFAPVYYAVFSKQEHKDVFTIIFILISILFSFIFRAFIREDLYAIINRIPVFLCGFYAAEKTYYSTSNKKQYIFVLFTILIMGCVLSWLSNHDIIPNFIPATNSLINVLIAPVLTVFISLFLQKINVEIPTLEKRLVKFFSFFGNLSFEMYVFQEWVWDKIETLQISEIYRHLLCFGVVMILSYGVHKLYEHIYRNGFKQNNLRCR